MTKRAGVAGARFTTNSRASTPATAARIEPTDAQRIQRALEVFRMTGEPLSTLQGRREAPSAR